MRLLLFSALVTTAAVVLATGGGAQSRQDEEVREAPEAGIIQTGPTLGPLSPDELHYEPVTVPEPVWASVLAACALSLLRRGRV